MAEKRKLPNVRDLITTRRPTVQGFDISPVTVPYYGQTISEAPIPGFLETAEEAASQSFSTAGTGRNAAVLRALRKATFTPEHEARARLEDIRRREAYEYRRAAIRDQIARRGGIGDTLRVGAGELVGETVGDINPLDLVPAFGATARLRVLGQAGLQAATDVLGQKSAEEAGLIPEYNPYQTAAAALLGGAAQGVAEGISAKVGRSIAQKSEELNLPVNDQTAIRSLSPDSALAQEAGDIVPPPAQDIAAIPVERPVPITQESIPPAVPETVPAQPDLFPETVPTPQPERAQTGDLFPETTQEPTLGEIRKDINDTYELRKQLINNPDSEQGRVLRERLGAGIASRYSVKQLTAAAEDGSVTNPIFAEAVAQKRTGIYNQIVETLSDPGSVSDEGAASIRQLIAEHGAADALYRGEVSKAAGILDTAAAAAAGGGKSFDFSGSLIRGPEDVLKLNELIKSHGENEAAKRKLIEDLSKPRPEDYVLSLWYNGVLSHPGTHVTNAVGTTTHVGLHGATKAAAFLSGLVRGAGKDRVYGSELAFNAYGLLRGLTLVGSKGDLSGGFDGFLNGYLGREAAQGAKAPRTVFKGKKSYVLESSTRLLNATDAFWSNVIKLSSVYGQAAKQASDEGVKLGRGAFLQRVEELVANPPKHFLDRADNSSKFLTFRDEPSAFTQRLERLRSRRVGESVPERIAKASSRIFVPFLQSPDRLLAATIRNSPASILSRETRKLLLEKSVKGDIARGRFAAGVGLTSYFYYLADQGLLTGPADTDYARAREQTSGVFQPSSLRLPDDSLVSFRGLDPLSAHANLVADLVNKHKRGELSDASFSEATYSVIGSVFEGLNDSFYLSGVSNLLQALTPGPTGDRARNRILPQAASSFIPAIVQAGVRAEDPTVRSTIGDGSLGDRIVGRVKAGLPVLSKELPQKYDVYGRPETQPDTLGGSLISRFKVKQPESDPVIRELSRLGDLTYKVLIDPVDRGDLRKFKATDEQVQKHQRYSGVFIVEAVRELMQSGEWDQLTDGERVATVREIKEDQRANAKAILFPDYYE